MKFRVSLGVAVLAGLPMFTAGAQAGETGMAAMHDQRVASGRLCFTDHAHVGTGGRAKSRRAALRLAASDWSAFTAFEYGSDWGHWRFARDKKINCGKSGAAYSCEVQAKPCLARRVRSATR